MGVGFNFSAFFFKKRASVAVPVQKQDSHSRQQASNIYVLAGTHFQVWSLNSDGQQCTCDLNMDDIIRKQFQRHIWVKKTELDLKNF